MAVERVTEEPDGTRTIERNDGVPAASTTTVVDRGGRGSGATGMIIALAVVVLVVIAGYFLLNMNKQNAVKNDAVAGAASSVADSAKSAAGSVSNAADKAADSVTH